VRKLLVLAVLLGGCTAYSGVVSIGPDTFMVARQKSTGRGGMGDMPAEAIADAQRFCQEHHQHQVARVIRTKESRPRSLFGRYPRAEVEFTCVPPVPPNP
jgi:hypothetical protein